MKINSRDDEKVSKSSMCCEIRKKVLRRIKTKELKKFKISNNDIALLPTVCEISRSNKNTLANSTSHYESIDRNKCGRNQSPMLIRRAFFTTHFLSFTSYDIVLMNLKHYPAYPFDRPVHFISSSLKVSHKQVFSAKSLKTRNVREKGFKCVEKYFSQVDA